MDLLRPAYRFAAVGFLLVGQPLAAQTVADVPAVATDAAPLQPSVPVKPGSPVDLKIQRTEPLTLQAVIDIALARSPQILLAQLAVERAEATERQEGAALLPALNFNLNYDYSQSAQTQQTIAILTRPTGIDQVLAGSSAFTPAQVQTLSAAFAASGSNFSGAFPVETTPLNGQVRVDWTFFSGGLLTGRVRAAQQQLAATRLDYQTTRQDVIDNAINAYYDLQTANGNLEIGEAAVRSAEAILKDADAQLRNGIATRFAVLQAQVQLANAKQQRLGYLNQQTIRRRGLARLLHFDQPTDVSAADPVESTGTWQLSLEQSIFESYNRRPELAAQLAREQAAKAQEESAYGLTSPQLGLFVAGQTYANLTGVVPDLFTGYSAGVQFQWRAFDGGAARAQADQAIADAKSARVRYRDQRDQIRFDVESSYSQLDISREQIDTARTGVDSATESLRLARRRFEEGVGTQTDVLVADRDLTQARVNLLTATIDYNRSIASLKRALSQL